MVKNVSTDLQPNERMRVELINNDLAAVIIYNLPPEDLDMKNRARLIDESLSALNEKGVVYGIKMELFDSEIINGMPYVIAEGVPPVHGSDSVIRMYELKESSPEIREDGKANYYELKLINIVKAGDWLGERIEATEGTPGISVKGEQIKPIPGRTYPLEYDRNTVEEVFEGTKTTLYAKINGAVNYDNGKLSVSNHLQIEGDVDLSTGNIKFDGYLTIRGTVCDGFSVEATKDIEINGELGLGNVKEIISTNGSIYIKGGIASKGRAQIRAAKNVYTKFVDNADIISGGTVHIGYYCLNSTITAKEVILDSASGKIIGGHVKAEVRVSSPIIGCEIEKKTLIEVTGFNRKLFMEQLSSSLHNLSELKKEQQSLKELLLNLDGPGQSDPSYRRRYNEAQERLSIIRDNIKKLEEERKNIMSYLKARGEGEISASRKIYPNSTLIIKQNRVDIQYQTLSTVYYVQDGVLKKI